MSLSLPRRLLCLVVLCLTLSGTIPATLVAQEATPVPEVSPFRADPAECVVDPLSPEEIEALVASELSGAEAPTITHDVPFAAPDGEPADPATTEAVSSMIRQTFACVNAGDWARYFALLTEQGAPRRSFSVRNITGMTSQPVAPFPLEQQTAVFAILDVEVLPDGRVGAFVVLGGSGYLPGDLPAVGIDYHILVETDEGWKLDDVICFSETGGPC